MNQFVQKAILDLSKLPEEPKEEIALHVLDLTAKKQIDGQLHAAEVRGGRTCSGEYFKELRSRYAG